MSTIIASPSKLALAGKARWWTPDFTAVIAFSLIGVFAALYMAAYYPLPEAIYALNIAGP